MSADEIDALIEQYLLLLDQYTTLRQELNSLQSSIHLNISRANFASERGIRYNQDYYDDRMQASIRLSATPDPTPTFTIVPVATKSDKKPIPSAPDEKVDHDYSNFAPGETSHRRGNDPLRWFGILTPQALRAAQSEAVTMVESLVPRLASADAALKDLEIRIRRARKHRAKAEAVAKKVDLSSVAMDRMKVG